MVSALIPGKSHQHICAVQLTSNFLHSYWDFSVSEEYSYVRAAAGAGYATFRYDRLGTGLSQKPADAYKHVSVWNEKSDTQN